MQRRTDVQILSETLERNGQSLSKAALSKILKEEREWTSEKVQRVTQRAIDDSKSRITTGKGGVIEYLGSEKVASPLLYRQVGKGLGGQWAIDHRLRNARYIDTSHGGHRGAQDWLHPDVVVVGSGRSQGAADSGERWHSFEVENAGRFRLNSIFQAFVQGRGSDYSWVVASEDDIDGEYRERVIWAAKQVGVGVITYRRPRAASTWRELRPALKRSHTRKERSDFLHYALGESEE